MADAVPFASTRTPLRSSAPAWQRKSSTCMPLSGASLPQPLTSVLLRGMPNMLCSPQMMEVVLEQAGLEWCLVAEPIVHQGPKYGEVLLRCVDARAAQLCVRHFGGCQWNQSDVAAVAIPESHLASFGVPIVAPREEEVPVSHLQGMARMPPARSSMFDCRSYEHVSLSENSNIQLPSDIEPPPGLALPESAPRQLLGIEPPPGLSLLGLSITCALVDGASKPSDAATISTCSDCTSETMSDAGGESSV